jgi:trimeric autotransporter adhesin
MMRRWILLLGVASAVLAGGCNDFNTTLGTPSNSTTISFLTPAGANAGGGAFTLGVEGDSFQSDSVVEWNGSARVTTYLNANELLAQISAADLATPGTVNVLVYTPGTAVSDPQTGENVIATSNVITFVIQAASAPLPTITSVSPMSVTASNSFTLKVTGTGFIAPVTSGAAQTTGTLISWNGSEIVQYMAGCAQTATTATTFVSTTEVDATVSNCVNVAAQTAQNARITVYNPPSGNPATGGGTSNTYLLPVAAGSGGNVRKEGIGIGGGAASASLSPAISTDTRYVAYVAPVPDPSIDASTGTDNVYVRDTCAGVAAGCTPSTALISVAADGTSAADGASESPSISADGRYVTFVSLADNLVAGGASGLGDIFVRDTCTGAPSGCTPATTLVSVAPDGSFANGPSDSPSISAGGRYVVFTSSATNLVAGTASAAPAIYLRDLCVGAPAGCVANTVLLSVSSSPPSGP